jgi:hypothetical protein
MYFISIVYGTRPDFSGGWLGRGYWLGPCLPTTHASRPIADRPRGGVVGVTKSKTEIRPDGAAMRVWPPPI